ncbi:hypothetical protein DFH09DRAFT_280601, partial [Mycena vulgaris]
RFIFRVALELQALLQNSPSLTELILSRIGFQTPLMHRAYARSPAPAPRAGVVVHSLRLLSFIPEEMLQQMLGSFTTVDLTHLRKLSLVSIDPLTIVLRANAGTLEEVSLYHRRHFEVNAPTDPAILGNLRLLHLNVTRAACAAVSRSSALSRI